MVHAKFTEKNAVRLCDFLRTVSEKCENTVQGTPMSIIYPASVLYSESVLYLASVLYSIVSVLYSLVRENVQKYLSSQ